jgi:hypothetical protein
MFAHFKSALCVSSRHNAVQPAKVHLQHLDGFLLIETRSCGGHIVPWSPPAWGDGGVLPGKITVLECGQRSLCRFGVHDRVNGLQGCGYGLAALVAGKAHGMAQSVDDVRLTPASGERPLQWPAEDRQRHEDRLVRHCLVAADIDPDRVHQHERMPCLIMHTFCDPKTRIPLY